MKTFQMAAPGQHSKLLAIGLTALFSLLSVITLVQLVGRVMESPEIPMARIAGVPTDQGPAGSVEISDWHLFGEAANGTLPARQSSAGTRQELVLRGTLTANDPSLARAIVADQQNFERAYQIGESLPGEKELTAIHTDHIVVRGARGEETIYLPREEQSGGPVASTQPATRTITANASALRDDLLRNPTLLAEAVVPMPVWQNNECKGYRFRPGKDAAFMKQVGLLSTDVVSAVNGIHLCSDGVLDALQSLAVADQVTVSIIRDGQRVDLNIQLKN
jgi:type II secretion system protein C